MATSIVYDYRSLNAFSAYCCIPLGTVFNVYPAGLFGSVLRMAGQPRVNSCRHAKTVTNFFGEEEERPYTSLFCPDCGEPTQQPGKTYPFKLRNR